MKKKFLLLLFIFSSIASAQDEIDTSTLDELEENLPSFQSTEVDDPSSQLRRAQERRYRPPRRVTLMSEIEASGVEYGSVNAGVTVTEIDTLQNKVINRPIFVRSYRLSDENGFKYLLNKEGKIIYKIHLNYFDPLKETTNLYVPPTRYSTSKVEKINSDYDGKLHIRPEVGAGADIVSSNFVADLLNDSSANMGYSSRFFASAYADWKIPVKLGATVHFERSFYKVDTGNAETTSISFGPLVRSKDFHLMEKRFRLMGQLRLSPFTTMNYTNATSEGTFKFNTYAALAGIEFPIKNFLGEFNIALYFQKQWFTLKDQEVPVNLKSQTTSNQSFGLMLSQVF